MVMGKAARLLATATAAVLFGGGALVGSAQASTTADNPVFFVHGYGYDDGTSGGKNCANTWGDAVDYFAKQGLSASSLKTVAYYKGDVNCDVRIGKATLDTRIKDVAAKLANYIYDKHTSDGQSVDIVAHSMGGLITRVALLGSAKGWAGFPKKLDVGDVVTLGTPHQGISKPDANDDTQWKSMRPGSTFLDVLQEPKNQLGEKWASGTDWTLLASDEDATVSGESAMDKGNHADHKFRYKTGNDGKVSHSGLRKLTSGKYELRYWHASEGTSHDTSNGWAPVKAAYNAVAKNTDW
ncbi:PGAP1-like protein [Tamaricihabitans halophyticus]|uniref:PGAP1-like protein n=1 Tax=Tamaricihabitans halophyticus TaxID=1262583 RepID=A0A4R2QY50_9PSEU|nr:hypothetical protein [Tamaricihabitans halophyticus]TCP54099.1 PGAP1-like protein [Tamaricihabitans halophyticus]